MAMFSPLLSRTRAAPVLAPRLEQPVAVAQAQMLILPAMTSAYFETGTSRQRQVLQARSRLQERRSIFLNLLLLQRLALPGGSRAMALPTASQCPRYFAAAARDFSPGRPGQLLPTPRQSVRSRSPILCAAASCSAEFSRESADRHCLNKMVACW